jgi:hypothetical protein
MFFDEIFKTHHAQSLSCSGLKVGVWLKVQPIFLGFQLTSLVFSTTFRIRLGLPHPSIASIPQCMCTHPIDYMGIHLLRCVHGNEHIRTHDVVHNTFATIVWDVGFHMGQKQLYVFLSNTFNSSRQQINIVLTQNGIHTFVDIVIADPTRMDLFPRSCVT